MFLRNFSPVERSRSLDKFGANLFLVSTSLNRRKGRTSERLESYATPVFARMALEELGQ